MIKISFSALGLCFDAKVSVTGEDRAATYDDPAEYFEIELEELTCCGYEASFMLDSAALEEFIREGAELATREVMNEMKNDFELDLRREALYGNIIY